MSKNYVMSHTSKVGYFTRNQIHVQKVYNRSTGVLTGTYNQSGTTGVSYRKSVQKSDGRKPTSYSRIIITASGNSYDYYSTTQRAVGDCSFWSNGLKMDPTPWGQLSLSSGNVSPSLYLEANAIARSKNKLNGNAANLLEDLAQARQTARMAADIVTDIGKATAKYLSVYGALLGAVGVPIVTGGIKRPKRKKGGLDLARRLAKAWLVWYYGVKPLISTLNELGEAWVPKYKTVRSTTRERAQLDPSGLFTNASTGRNRISVSGEAYEEVTCVLIVDVKLSSNLNALANLGFHGGDVYADSVRNDSNGLLTTTDALSTAWAIIPYSFVFDWIIPVESFLRSLYWSPNMTYKGGYVSKYMYGKVRGIIQNNTSFDYGYGGKMPSGTVEALLFEREAFDNYPPPSILAVNQSISAPALASAIALGVLAK